jgi:hypothetical protein
MYQNRSIEEIQEAAYGVMNNHEGNNLQLKISTPSSINKNGSRPKILFKDDFFKFSVQQIEFPQRDGGQPERRPAMLAQRTDEAGAWSDNYLDAKDRATLNRKVRSNRVETHEENIKLVEFGKVPRKESAKSLFSLNLNWGNLTLQEFLKVATESIEVSTAFQRHLQEYSVHPNILKLAEKSMNELIINRFGCHILRLLLQKSSSIYDRLVNLVKREFAVYCCNQFSNKVIQALAEEQIVFANYCLEEIYSHWDHVKKYIPTSYLLNICLSRVPATSNQFQLIGQALIARSQSIWKDKYDKRLLLDYLVYCPSGQLDYFFHALNYQLHFEKRIQDRYLAQALGLLFKRGHHLTHELVLKNLNESMAYFLSMKNFRFLIVELLKGQSEPFGHSSRLLETLLSAPELISRYSDILSIAKNATVYMQHPNSCTKM